MLTVKDFPETRLFWSDVARPLMARAVPTNIFVGVADRMRRVHGDGQLRVGVFDGEALVLGALMTPPFRLNIASTDGTTRGVDELARHVKTLRNRLPGVYGEEHIALAFAKSWTKTTGQKEAGGADPHGRRQNLYQVTEVIPPKNVPGHDRVARGGEEERIQKWEIAFAVDAGLGESERDPLFVAERVVEGMKAGEIYQWEVAGQPVASARLRRIGDIGYRISGVYTPNEHRGHGYAAALTAAISRIALDQGRWCCLYADAANPLTNRIYQRIGFRHLGVFADLLFA